jgi:hypothetical protein
MARQTPWGCAREALDALMTSSWLCVPPYLWEKRVPSAFGTPRAHREDGGSAVLSARSATMATQAATSESLTPTGGPHLTNSSAARSRAIRNEPETLAVAALRLKEVRPVVAPHWGTPAA